MYIEFWSIACVVGIVVGFCFGWAYKTAPKFKTGRMSGGSYSDGTHWAAEIKHIRWSDFHKQWTYYVIWDDREGYYLASDIKEMT